MRSRQRVAIACLSVLLAGCPLMLVDNAANYAEQAAAAANACEQADVRDAASRAQGAAQDAAAAAQAQAQYNEEADRTRRYAENRRRIAEEARLQERRRRDEAQAIADFKANASADAATQAEIYESAARRFEQCDEWLTFCGGMPALECESEAQCRRLAREKREEAAKLAVADEQMAKLNAEADAFAAQAAEALKQAEQAERDAASAEARAGAEGQKLRVAEEQAAQAAAEAQRAAFEQCLVATASSVEPPPPIGGYQQDVFGAQSLGVPGAGLPGSSCTPAFQGLCLGIQASCLASCSSTGSCSPGAPSPCMSCFAQGCF